MDNPRKVLIISYHFPPDAEVGGLRAQKFAKYLPLFGWTPFVLSVNEKYYCQRDEERCRDLNCLVVRTRILLSLREAYLITKKLIHLCLKNGRTPQLQSMQHKESELQLHERSVSSLKRFILPFLWVPDDRTGWIIPAVIRGLKLIKKCKIDTILTTSPPHSVQIIGLLLKKISKKTWVVDFRDPWTLSFGKEIRFIHKMHRWLEKKVVEKSDVVITATDLVRQGYMKIFPNLPSKKFVCIPNGFDVEDFDIARKSRSSNQDKFIISYLGEFYLGRTPEFFLKAMSDLTKEGNVAIDRLRIRFIGRVRQFGGRLLYDLVSELRLSPVTEISDPVPYFKAIEYMVESDVLLVFSPQPFFQPTKVFEYMAARAHIIAFTAPGALADLVSRYPKGIVVDYDDVEGAKKAMNFCYERFLNGEKISELERTRIDNFLLEYERRNLTKQLSAYL